MWWHRRKQKDFAEEIEAHIAFEADELRARGVNPDDAEAAARRAFGNLTGARERYYESRRFVWLDHLLQDLRYGARILRRNPAFSFVAIVCLALGIGLNTTAFTLIDAVVLRPLPVKDPERVVRLHRVRLDPRQRVQRTIFFSYRDYLHLRRQRSILNDLIAYGWTNAFVKGPARNADPQAMAGLFVTGNYFTALGVTPALGRILLDDDDRPGGPPVVVLTHQAWIRRFDADQDIAGKTVFLNRQPFTVAGVLPEGFTTDIDVPSFMVPISRIADLRTDAQKLESQEEQWLRLIGRLSDGLDFTQAATGLNVASANPGDGEPYRIELAPAQLTGDQEGMAIASGLLLATVGLVLVIACTNLTNLLLARAEARKSEIGVRLSLGASRLRLVRQLLTESTLLTMLGGAAGMLASIWMMNATLALLQRLVPADAGFFHLDLSPDSRIAGFTLAISVLTGALFGLAPALEASRPDITAALKHDDGSRKPGRSRLRNLLVVTQVAASAILLVVAGLLLRTLGRVVDIGNGVETKTVMLRFFPLAEQKYTPVEAANFYRSLTERVRRIRGVASVSLSTGLALTGGSNGPITVPGAAGATRKPLARVQSISATFLKTLGIPIVRGRSFTEQEIATRAPVAIVSRQLAGELWPGEEALGKMFQSEMTQGWVRVVGVIPDIGPRQVTMVGVGNLALLPLGSGVAQPADLFLLVRTEGDPKRAMPAVRDEIRALDSGLASQLYTMEEMLQYTLLGPKIIVGAAAVVGLLALLLAAVGLYGVTAYIAAGRTHEIGIRMALGARKGSVLRLVLAQGTRLVLAGLVLGLTAAATLSLVARPFVLDLVLLDPVAYMGVALFLAVVALMAMYLPARRAARLDPLSALRHK